MSIFVSKWGIGEILELKHSDTFVGKVLSVSFDGQQVAYSLRRPDGVVVFCTEDELEIKGAQEAEEKMQYPTGLYALDSENSPADVTLAYAYYNPDEHCGGFGFNVADGHTFLPFSDVPSTTTVTSVTAVYTDDFARLTQLLSSVRETFAVDDLTPDQEKWFAQHSLPIVTLE